MPRSTPPRPSCYARGVELARRHLGTLALLAVLAGCERTRREEESASGRTTDARDTDRVEREAGPPPAAAAPKEQDGGGSASFADVAATVESPAPPPRSVPGSNRLEDRIPPPPGFARVPLDEGSFGAWLRGLPLKPGRPPVLLFDGREKANQTAHFAVVDLSVGERDLQQCADAVMRLRAEWLFAAGRWDEIAFDFTTGERVDFLRWSRGWRPRVENRRVVWTRGGRPGRTHDDLLAYLTRVFMYAGSASLARELEPIDADDLRPGDLFIRGGFPGHAVLVVDLARDAAGRAAFLLAQSYMPAQEVHVLVNPTDDRLSPWYPLDFGEALRTPEWTFRRDEARRFPERGAPVSR